MTLAILSFSVMTHFLSRPRPSTSMYSVLLPSSSLLLSISPSLRTGANRDPLWSSPWPSALWCVVHSSVERAHPSALRGVQLAPKYTMFVHTSTLLHYVNRYLKGETIPELVVYWDMWSQHGTGFIKRDVPTVWLRSVHPSFFGFLHCADTSTANASSRNATLRPCPAPASTYSSCPST